MNQTIKRISILAGIFVIAVLIYFIWNINTQNHTDTVYTTMEEPQFPVVYMEMFGEEMNLLRGYAQEAQQAAGDSLTILPEDRQLRIQIRESGDKVSGIRYEIRSLDEERLVERTALTDWEETDGALTAVLPIQNLLERETQYQLKLILETADQEEIRYYTRILWTEDETAVSMIEMAKTFSEGTLNPEQADGLAVYLESSSTADNSSLGHVTIQCSYDQVTWGDLDVARESTPFVTLRELEGVMGEIQIDYLASRTVEDGKKELMEVTEYFTVKWSAQRNYLMNYNREVNEIFMGSRDAFSGKRIVLGIGNLENLSAQTSPNGRFLGFVANRDLWSFDQQEQEAVRVFSFRSEDENDVRSSSGRHDVRLLRAEDDGSMDFLVYGYMNRGRHEGNVGAALYHYDSEKNALEEQFFIPVNETFEQLKQEADELSYLSSSGMLYLMLNHAFYGIDLNSGEYMVVAEGLTQGRYAVSLDGTRLAWQDGSGLYDASVIHLMSLDSGQKHEIRAENGGRVRVLGFVGSDFIYGLASEGEEWVVNGRVAELPMYALEILDAELNVATHYEPEGYRITGVTVDGSRIHLQKVISLSGQDYAVSDEDIIVCNVEIEEETHDLVGWYASEEKKRVYFVQTDREIESGRRIRVSAPRRLTYDQAEILNLDSGYRAQGIVFYAYGNGRLLGTTQSAAEAVSLAYDGMGYVTDQHHRMIWNRVSRGISRTLRDPAALYREMSRTLTGFEGTMQTGDGRILLDLRGCTLQQVLYFIDRGQPVIAYTDRSEPAVLYGFDQYNVSVYYPDTGETQKMGLGDAAQYFTRYDNDFVGAVSAE